MDICLRRYICPMTNAHVRRYDDMIWVHVMVIWWLILFKLHGKISFSLSLDSSESIWLTQSLNWLFKLFQTRKRLSMPSIYMPMCRFVSILVVVGAITPTPYGIRKCKKIENNQSQRYPSIECRSTIHPSEWKSVGSVAVTIRHSWAINLNFFFYAKKQQQQHRQRHSRTLYSWCAKYGTESAFYIRY